VSNAIKYRSDKRELVINFASHITYDFHMLSISDNGLGVDLEKHGHKIFGLFKRAHDHVEGSGFGLYMVKNVLEKAGGRISLESTVDEGSTFNLFFKKSL
jgi:signal transduction histidine kinase